MRRDIYRTDPDGEPDYDGYEEIPDEDEEWERELFYESYKW